MPALDGSAFFAAQSIYLFSGDDPKNAYLRAVGSLNLKSGGTLAMSRIVRSGARGPLWPRG